MKPLNLKDIEAINQLRQSSKIDREASQEIRKKAIYQLVWAEGPALGHHSEFGHHNWIEAEKEFKENKMRVFNKPAWTFIQLDLLLKQIEHRFPPPDHAPGTYDKHKFALFCPVRSFLAFTVRYDMWDTPSDNLLTCMLY